MLIRFKTFLILFQSIQMGVAAMVPVVLYPLAKRFTMFPQAVLGLTFNVGALMGYAAVCETLNWTLMGALYASCFTWTIYYDTIYAFQVINAWCVHSCFCHQKA